MKQDIL